VNEYRSVLERGGSNFAPLDLELESILRRRDRKRRNQRIAAGVVGIAVFVVAIWIVTSVGSLDRSETSVVPGGDVSGPTVDPFSGFNGLPPEGASTSEPLLGELVMTDSGTHPRFSVNVYADGRLIWFRQDQGEYPNAWIEQRLTPAGVHLLVSGVLPLGVQFEDPGEQLPAYVWEDPELRPYVPSRYAVLPSRDIGRFLPAAALDLIAGTERAVQAIRRTGESHGWIAQRFGAVVGAPDGVGEGLIFQVTVEDARSIAQILSNAGFVGGETGPLGTVWFSARGASTGHGLLQFVPVLPDGTFVACFATRACAGEDLT
jgi:hypothetical protein